MFSHGHSSVPACEGLGYRAEQLSRTAAFCGRPRLVLESCEHGGKVGAARAVAIFDESSRRPVLRSALSQGQPISS